MNTVHSLFEKLLSALPHVYSSSQITTTHVGFQVILVERKATIHARPNFKSLELAQNPEKLDTLAAGMLSSATSPPMASSFTFTS